MILLPGKQNNVLFLLVSEQDDDEPVVHINPTVKVLLPESNSWVIIKEITERGLGWYAFNLEIPALSSGFVIVEAEGDGAKRWRYVHNISTVESDVVAALESKLDVFVKASSEALDNKVINFSERGLDD